MRFTDREHITITFQGKSRRAQILLKSDDELSLVLSFRGKLFQYERILPAIWRKGRYVDLIFGRPLKLRQPRNIRQGKTYPPVKPLMKSIPI